VSEYPLDHIATGPNLSDRISREIILELEVDIPTSNTWLCSCYFIFTDGQTDEWTDNLHNRALRSVASRRKTWQILKQLNSVWNSLEEVLLQLCH